MDLQRIQHDVRHAAQIDGAHRGAVRRSAVGEGLGAAGPAKLMADLVLIEGVGAEPVLAAAERERADGKERQQQAFAAANRTVAAEGFGGQFGVDGEGDGAAVAASLE